MFFTHIKLYVRTSRGGGDRICKTCVGCFAKRERGDIAKARCQSSVGVARWREHTAEIVRFIENFLGTLHATYPILACAKSLAAIALVIYRICMYVCTVVQMTHNACRKPRVLLNRPLTTIATTVVVCVRKELREQTETFLVQIILSLINN